MLFLAAELNPYLSLFLSNLLEIVGALVLIACVPLVRYLVKLFEVKVGMDVSAEREEQLKTVLMDGVARAEEWARTKVASSEPLPPGAQKMAKAMEFVEEEIKRRKLDELSKEKLEELLNAKLGLTKLGPTP